MNGFFDVLFKTIPGCALVLSASKKLPLVAISNQLLASLNYNKQEAFTRFEKSSAKLFDAETFKQLTENAQNENFVENHSTMTLRTKEAKELYFKCSAKRLSSAEINATSAQILQNAQVDASCASADAQNSTSAQTGADAQSSFIIIYLQDISAFVEQKKSIDEQTALISMTKVKLMQELEYERYLHQINTALYSYVCEIDLTNNVLLSTSNDTFLKRLELNIDDATYDAFLRNMCATFIHPDYHKNCLSKFKQSALLKCFAKNEPLVTLQCRATEDGKNFYWMEITARVFQYPATYSILCVLYFKNIDKSKKQEIVLLERAKKDSLTQFFNTRTIQTMIETSLASDQDKNGKHALLLLDLDNFKKVNDSLGHAFGDKVLVEFSDEIRKSFFEDEYIGRIGGDEFIVFIKNYGKKDVLIRRVKTLCENLVKKYDGNITQYAVSASIGIALYPEHGTNYKQLTEAADSAMYHAKGHGKSTFTLYNRELTADNSRFFRERDVSHIIDAATDGIGKYALNEKLSLLFYNQKLLSLFGVSADDAQNDNFTTFDAIIDEDKAKIIQLAKKALKTGDAFVATCRIRIKTFDENAGENLQTEKTIRVKGIFTEELYQSQYPVFYLLHSDMSDVAKLKEEMAFQNKKHSLLNEFTNDITYEYYPATNNFVLAGSSLESLAKGIGKLSNKVINYVQPDTLLAQNRERLQKVLKDKTEMFATELTLLHRTKQEVPVIIYGKPVQKKQSAMPVIIGKIISLAEREQQQNEIETSKRMLSSLQQVAVLLISTSLGTFSERFYRALAVLGSALRVDSVSLWRLDIDDNDKMYSILLYEWTQLFTTFKGSVMSEEMLDKGSFANFITRLQKNIWFLYSKDILDGKNLRLMQDTPYQSVFVMPIHIDGKLWGCLSIGDAVKDIQLTHNQIEFLKIFSQLIISSLDERLHS